MKSDRTAVYLQILAAAARAAAADCGPQHIRWNYETGLLLSSLAEVSERCFGGLLDELVKERVDALVSREGDISGYSQDDFNLDQINPGRVLFWTWKKRGDVVLEKSLASLMAQLASQPRTQSGSYWHKKIYPNQVWLDGLYMFGPFQARCGREFGRPKLIDDVCAQFLAARATMRHGASGLYYHAKDESRSSKWADPETGCSPHVWARAVGWLSMALADVLDCIPTGHDARDSMIGMLAELLDAVVCCQQTSGLWLQVVDQPSLPGNYEETSASAMFAYSLYKGARKHYGSNREKAWRSAAERALDGILVKKVSWDCPKGAIPRFHLGGICKVAGLGGNPYRDGSFEYYIREPVVSDDFKGTGPLIFALGEAVRAEPR